MKYLLIGFLMITVFAASGLAVVLDKCNGQYWSWDAQTGVLSDWDLNLTGGSTAIIEGGGLHVVDPGLDAIAEAMYMFSQFEQPKVVERKDNLQNSSSAGYKLLLYLTISANTDAHVQFYCRRRPF
ncbi:MAG: hypothetical protein ABIG61_04180 [Planctomycetota bacterium]